MRLPYDEQIRSKEDKLSKSLSAAGIDNSKVKTFFKAPNQFGYRNKAKFIVAGDTNKPTLGMADAHQNVVDLPECPLHDPIIIELSSALKEAITKYKLTPYNIKARSGELKGIIVRVGARSQEIGVRFIIRSKELENNIRAAATDLQTRNPKIKVLSLNIQPKPAAILEGPEEIILSEESRIHESLGGFNLGVSPQSFSQVQSSCAEALYKRAAQFIAEAKPKFLVDLFCGTGCFSIFSASSCNAVLGIELSVSSISDAKYSADKNGIENIKYEVGLADDLKKSIGSQAVDCLVVNPPRRGLGEKLCSDIATLAPQHLIYSSCNADSLASDLALLKGYEISTCEIFDMFPLTEHFETLVKLTIKP